MSQSKLKEQKTRDRRTIGELIKALGSADDGKRLEARNAIVSFHQSVTADLIGALQSPQTRTRWEAAKALGEFKDPIAISALVSALQDRENDVRWAAADALIASGSESVVPLLCALELHADSIHLRHIGKHILRILEVKNGLKATVSPVIAALEGMEPVLTVPIAAHYALDHWAKVP